MPTAADIKARLMVGMEIHVELATRSKMFTSAPNVAHPDYFDAEPNSLCDPVVLGMPGVLPVMNRRAVEMSMLVGLALGCTINRKTKWDRKSYYYPDLPKNYQISQYDQPLCIDGSVESPVSDQPGAATRTIRIIRAHLEEDAGKLLHEAPGGFAIDYSIVDLNRAGTPLLEIVTHPDFDSAEQVVAFGQALRNICRFLGVTEGIMQKGHMRFEPNINVVIERDGKTYKTPIVEIKNLNSFKALHGAVNYEYQRQIDEWLETGVVMKAGAKSTRGWDDTTGSTFLQREKEEAHDYRYFPDPDLVHVVVDDAWMARVKAQLLELPLAREKRYIETLGMSVKDARALIDEPRACLFFEAVLAAGVDAKRASSIMLNNLAKRANERACRVDELGISASQVKAIADLSAADKIGSAAADDLIGLCCESANKDADPLKLAEQRGLLQVSDDSALDEWVQQVIAQNEKVVAQIKAGKESAIMSLMGGVMKLSKGKANAKVVQEKLRKALLG
ncbi:MAG: Asp-tRNA(Asn)/Glu-tRNA(Gln) amidotransferase subunit GatB [Planctomycetes bacterium]|nr:Asp-tRNA(Asn)/Glu-tRNA(Gln) amidotransferase subunit GatB [Planctomycetota bacterium]